MLLSHRFITVVAGLFLLSGCGFTPVYHSSSTDYHENIRAAFDRIYIESIPDRSGQVLRNKLIDKLYTYGRPSEPNYVLSIGSIKQRKTDLDVTKSSDATRAQIRLTTTMVLKDQASGEELLSRNLTATTSYNVLESQFTTIVSEDYARENALEDLAIQIERYLSLYFKRQ